MLYIALGCAALWLILWLSGGKPILKRREWRFASAIAAIAAFAGAAFAALRGAWEPSVVLIVLGLWLAASTRRTGLGSREPSSRMSLDEARSILGVDAEASAEEIQTAYMRLMRLAHPDRGGTSGLAAQLNAARDRLLKP